MNRMDWRRRLRHPVALLHALPQEPELIDPRRRLFTAAIAAAMVP